MKPKITETTADQLTQKGNGVLQYGQYGNGTAFHSQVPAYQVAPKAPDAPLKVALIGTAPSSRMLAPFQDETWKIWACSPGNMNVLPRVDLWFELHANLLWPECSTYGPPYIEWLKQQKFPIYMQNQDLVPNAMVFPKRELVKKFSRYFFTSSFTWMIAFAIHSGAKEIALYGVDMASRDEYILQRQAFYHFLHLCESTGIKLSAPSESDIMQPPCLYGYTEATPYGRKLGARRSELKQRIAACEQQVQGNSQTGGYLKGAEEDLDYNQVIWGSVADENVLLKEDNQELRQENERLRQDMAALQQGVVVPIVAVEEQPAQVAAS